MLFPTDEQVELPYNAVVPGSVRYVENGALVRSEQFPVEERFKVSPDAGYQVLIGWGTIHGKLGKQLACNEHKPWGRGSMD